ncbi:MAG: regulator, partial [Bacteroidota bacterium]
GASIWIPQTQYQKEKAQLVSKQVALQKEHQAEVEKSEKEIMKLKNEKLEDEVRHKNQELASTAMHLVQKSEILTRIKQELSNLSQSKDQNEIKTEIRKLVKIIDQDIEYDKNWEQFEHHFDQVHHDYLRKLRNHFPQLTPKDLKLCAYLRMNLQTKEIAPLMNISVRGVEISRYRLRKKLELDRSTNLIEFLLNV